jgi:hypothetical protein
MASRNLMHKNKLEDFKKWCDRMNIPYRPGKGQYQVLQILTEFFGWKIIYKRNDMPEHYSLDEKLVPIIKKFIDSQK